MSDSISRMATSRQAIQPAALPAFDPTGDKKLDAILARWREHASKGIVSALNALALAVDKPLRRYVGTITGSEYLVNNYAVIPHRLASLNLVGTIYKTSGADGKALAIQSSVGATIQRIASDVDSARIVLWAAPSPNEVFTVVLLG